MTQINYLLAQNAFTPYEPITIDSDELYAHLQDLYGEEPCYNFNDGQYKTQLITLIDKLAASVIRDEYNPDYQESVQEVELLKMQLGETSYVAESPQVQEAYFLTYKKNLETIFFLIKDWTQTKRSQFILDLKDRIKVCATGAHTQLGDLIFELTVKPSPTSWLAELRKNILHVFAENWIAINSITDSSSAHVHHFCQTLAASLGWNVPGFNKIDGYKDENFRPKNLNQQTEKELKDYFLSKYNAQAIKDNLILNFNLMLSFYYDRLITPVQDRNICSILEPFTKHEIFDMSAVYTYDDDGDWRINPAFQVKLPEYVEAFMLREGLVMSRAHSLIHNQMIPLLDTEINRLTKKYGETEPRISVLNNTKNFISETLAQDEQTTDYRTLISTHLKEVYLRKDLDKYNPLEKIGIALLNILMILPLGIAGAIKYATTGHFFFSSCGKTQELVANLSQQSFKVY